jgi:hypothetical protein
MRTFAMITVLLIGSTTQALATKIVGNGIWDIVSNEDSGCTVVKADDNASGVLVARGYDTQEAAQNALHSECQAPSHVWRWPW